MRKSTMTTFLREHDVVTGQRGVGQGDPLFRVDVIANDCEPGMRVHVTREDGACATLCLEIRDRQPSIVLKKDATHHALKIRSIRGAIEKR